MPDERLDLLIEMQSGLSNRLHSIETRLSAIEQMQMTQGQTTDGPYGLMSQLDSIEGKLGRLIPSPASNMAVDAAIFWVPVCVIGFALYFLNEWLRGSEIVGFVAFLVVLVVFVITIASIARIGWRVALRKKTSNAMLGFIVHAVGIIAAAIFIIRLMAAR